MARKRQREDTWKAAITELNQVDDAVYDAIATSRGPVLDSFMPKLTNIADHGVLWWGMAGLLALTGGARGRRAALRGMATLGVSSLLANQVFKRTIHRQRPDRSLLPFGRNGRRRPTSSSFPSGHAASPPPSPRAPRRNGRASASRSARLPGPSGSRGSQRAPTTRPTY